ncbi:hypothetical protein SAMN05421684_8389 [Asanoa ishikariensis]|uniref:Helix-turn-helix domain-containing protein n=1 Tax=Asanoa ishikariensis TaxID=137265 RepID=A0A1H3UXV9_9ACTN|nr:hypothetical protein [Asanoa ishikariensis]SDZ67253.1 hypothetical protein SAMN05421684_8389 [Asanoa ishikariensis]
MLYTGPFHLALRKAIRDRGLSLDRVRAHLARRGVSIALSSLSDWQTGRCRPGNDSTVAALEDVLRLPTGALSRLLRVRRRLPDIGPVAELLDAVADSGPDDLELVSVQQRVDVDDDGRFAGLRVRTAIRALRDGVDRYVARFYGDGGCDPHLLRTRPVRNCRLGRRLVHPSAPAMVYELVFEEALRAGDTWVFESRLVDPGAGRCSEFAFGFRYPAEQCLLEVQFHPAALPAGTRAFAQFDLADQRHVIGGLALSRHHAVHLIASGVDSGVLGIAWDWR